MVMLLNSHVKKKQSTL